MSSEKPWFPVILAGLATTALTLFGLYVLNSNTDEFNVMGWYANGIIPIGAILVGLIAASGYGIVSWFMGIKIDKMLLGMVVGIQFLAYVAAQYVEYVDVTHGIAAVQEKLANSPEMKGLTPRERQQAIEQAGLPPLFSKALVTGKQPSFFEYYDASARSLAWKDKYSNGNQPLGAWGYGLRVLEVLGFVGGSLIAPLVLLSHPFCERCQRYMRGKQVAVIPAAVPTKLFQKSDPAAVAAAGEEGLKTLDQLRSLAAEGKIGEFMEAVRPLEAQRKATAQLVRYFTVSVMRCPGCQDGYLRVQLTEGKGRQVKVTEVAEKKVPLQPEFVRAVAG